MLDQSESNARNVNIWLGNRPVSKPTLSRVSDSQWYIYHLQAATLFYTKLWFAVFQRVF